MASRAWSLEGRWSRLEVGIGRGESEEGGFER